MKKLFPLLLIAFTIGAADSASAQAKPKKKAKRAYAHTSESGKGKTDKAHFRHETNAPTIDLHPHKQATFKTAKVQHYKYYNPH